MRAFSAAALVSLLLAGCEVGPDPAEMERVRQGTETVRQSLKMPQSALFKGVISPREAVCGEVNASMGLGRTGYERFIVKQGKMTLSSQLPTEAEMDARWADECK
jgi:hypothetical protein